MAQYHSKAEAQMFALGTRAKITGKYGQTITPQQLRDYMPATRSKVPATRGKN